MSEEELHEQLLYAISEQQELNSKHLHMRRFFIHQRHTKNNKDLRSARPKVPPIPPSLQIVWEEMPEEEHEKIRRNPILIFALRDKMMYQALQRSTIDELKIYLVALTKYNGVPSKLALRTYGNLISTHDLEITPPDRYAFFRGELSLAYSQDLIAGPGRPGIPPPPGKSGSNDPTDQTEE